MDNSNIFVPPFSLMLQNSLPAQIQQSSSQKQEVFSELWNRQKAFPLSNK